MESTNIIVEVEMKDRTKDGMVIAEHLFNYANSNVDLHLTETLTPFKDYKLYDIRIKKRMEEDKIYLNNSEIRFKIRRGNCIAKYILENESESKFKICRKGLVKFFDYLKVYKNNVKKEEKIVMDPIKNIFKNGKNLKIYLSEKANGENVQIAYDPIIKAWIIGSKNVTIACRTIEDIKFYSDYSTNEKTKQNEEKINSLRFSYCVEFASLWFEILEKNIISKKKFDEFINDIIGYTLIAENVGDPNHQHIKLYTEKTLIFYGMIQNDSIDISIPLTQSYEILNKKYGLNFVNFEVSPIFQNFKDFKKAMDDIYTDILKKDVENGGEGSVAYFNSVDSETGFEEVVSMGKLKTFEYRFLRKLREKIKGFLKKKPSVKEVLKKIESESKDILGQDGDDLDLTEWMNFAEFVLKFIEKCKGKFDFTDQYATFINEMKNLYIKEHSGFVLTDDVIKNVSHKYVSKSKEEKIEDNKIDDSIIDELKKNLIQISTVNYFQESELDKFPNYEQTRLKALTDQSSKTFKKGGLYFFINMGLVGGGKSTFFSIIKKIVTEEYSEIINLLYVSSDQIKGKLIDEYLKNNPNADLDTAHQKTSKAANSAFNESIYDLIKYRRDNDKINILFADKNFPGERINEFYKEMMKIDKKLNYEVYIFHPFIKFPINLYKSYYPFSLNYFIQCYYRLKNRKGHETLDFDKNPDSHYILVGFMSLYKGFKLPSKNENNRIIYFPLSFCDEKSINYSSNDFKLFEDMMRIGPQAFNIDKAKGQDRLIKAFFNEIEKNYPENLYENTLDKIEHEISDFFKAKVYGKIE